MANEKLFYVGVKALIENDKGQYLLLKADVSNHKLVTEAYWDIPGGRIEEGQTILETLGREVKEETGIEEIVDTTFFTAVISNHEVPISDTKNGGLVLMIYKVTIPADSKVSLSPEHTAYAWLDSTDAKQRLQHKYPQEFTNIL